MNETERQLLFEIHDRVMNLPCQGNSERLKRLEKTESGIFKIFLETGKIILASIAGYFAGGGGIK